MLRRCTHTAGSCTRRRREGGEKSTETHKKIVGTIETNLEKQAEHQDALKKKKKKSR